MGVDLRERRQLDMAEQVAKVKARARPWRSIFLATLAIAAAIVSRIYAGRVHDAKVHAALTHTQPPSLASPDRWVALGAAIAFPLLALAATMGLSGKARDTLQPRIGSMHATLVRIVLVLIGVIATVIVSLSLFGLPVAQLVLGGAFIGVLLGIAAQQTLANLFAGIVLLQARPFAVGDDVWIKSGALGGQYEGAVTEIGLTYVRLDTGDGLVNLPNTQVLAAAVGPQMTSPSGEPSRAPDASSAGRPPAPDAADS
jgi:small-conductance mechanosensitive channel